MVIRYSSICALGIAGLASSVGACTGDPGPAGATGGTGAAGFSTQDDRKQDAGVASDSGSAPAFLLAPNWSYLERTSAPIVLTAIDDSVNFTVSPPKFVSFGNEITVTNVTVLNAKSISVTVSPTKNAATGSRAVAVITDAGAFTAPNSFAVRSPIAVAATGTPTQGGRVQVTLKNADSLPFDRDTVRLLPTPEPAFVSLSATPSGLSGKGPGVVQFTALVDALAPVGGMQFGLGNFSLNPAKADTVYFSDPLAMPVAAANLRAISPGSVLATVDADVATALGTVVYKLASGATPEAGKLWNVKVAPTGTAAKPALWLTARSGRARDLLRVAGVTGVYAPPPAMLIPFDGLTGDLYMIVGDADARGGKAPDLGWSVTAEAITTQTITEQATDHATGAAQSITAAPGSAVVISGKIASAAEVDVYEIKLPAVGRLTTSITRRNFLGAVDVSADSSFATFTRLPSTGATWNAQATTGSTASTWYVRVAGTDTEDLTSYVLGARPE